MESPVANIFPVTALWSKYRGAGSCTATVCRRMLSFLKHFLHDPGQGSASMLCSPTTKWRHWEWEVQHSVSSEALQKNSVVFSNGVPQQTVVQSRLPQLENWSLALGRAQAFLVDRYLPYLTWLARAPAGRPECTNCQKIRAQVAQAADSCCTLSQAFHCSDLGDDLTADPQTINRAAVTK